MNHFYFAENKNQVQQQISARLCNTPRSIMVQSKRSGLGSKLGASLHSGSITVNACVTLGYWNFWALISSFLYKYIDNTAYLICEH